MNEVTEMETREIAGLTTHVLPANAEAASLVVLLHGYDGFATDLSPFAASLRLPCAFAFPEAPEPATPGGRGGHAWWPINDESRIRAQRLRTPRDLSDMSPKGLPLARARILAFLERIGSEMRPTSVVLGGFSQGAMLACDIAWRDRRALQGLVVLSGARICGAEWASLYTRRRGLPVFVSHGKEDPELSFHAAHSFQNELQAHGLATTWTPFEGGHEVPLPALRALKRFLAATCAGSTQEA